MTTPLLLAATSVLLLGDSHALGLVKGGGPSLFLVLGQELGPAYEVRLSACPGSTVLDWTRPARGEARCSTAGAYESLARPHLPTDVAAVLLGTNDAAGFGEAGPVSPEAYDRAMRALVDALLRDGVRHVILIPAPRSAGPFAGPARTPRLEGYREVLHAIADENPRVSRGPDLLELIELDTHLPRGGVHFNAAGHRLAAERLALDVRAAAAGLGPGDGDPSGSRSRGDEASGDGGMP